VIEFLGLEVHWWMIVIPILFMGVVVCMIGIGGGWDE